VLVNFWCPPALRWYWSIFDINLHGPLLTDVALQGLADDLTGARAAFKTNWEKLLEAGAVKREIAGIAAGDN
jgi:hypothetical protein